MAPANRAPMSAARALVMNCGILALLSAFAQVKNKQRFGTAQILTELAFPPFGLGVAIGFQQRRHVIRRSFAPAWSWNIRIGELFHRRAEVVLHLMIDALDGILAFCQRAAEEARQWVRQREQAVRWN